MANAMTTPARLSRPFTGPQAWTAAALDDRAHWYYPLRPRCLTALDRVVDDLRRHPRPTTELRLAESDSGWAEDLRPARAALASGRGFAIIQGLPRDRCTPQELQAIYWLIGQALGVPFAQNVEGALLYDVRDYGQDVRQGARFSVTSAESSFHTDNSFGITLLDYVGLLCLNAARAGGVNELVSAYTAHNELLAHHPDALAVLYEPFHIDRRGGVAAGEAPTIQRPVLEWDGRQLTVRYLRYWIEVGHDKAGVPLTPEQVAALDLFDRLLGRRDWWAEFALRPGEIFFCNNRWILHNRTAFEDHPEPDRRRHLVRLWLRA
jgi:alpha-ketoglutarate-dependent taurine dioxygenase